MAESEYAKFTQDFYGTGGAGAQLEAEIAVIRRDSNRVTLAS